MKGWFRLPFVSSSGATPVKKPKSFVSGVFREAFVKRRSIDLGRLIYTLPICDIPAL
jgi:hypothetical protein